MKLEVKVKVIQEHTRLSHKMSVTRERKEPKRVKQIGEIC